VDELGRRGDYLKRIARACVNAVMHRCADPAFFLWVVSRQTDPNLKAKFARILVRTARNFVDAAAAYVPRDALQSEMEDNAYVTFFGGAAAPLIELSVVVRVKNVGGAQITALLASLLDVPLATEIIVIDDGGLREDNLRATGYSILIDRLHALR